MLMAAMKWPVFDDVTKLLLQNLATQPLDESNRNVLTMAMRWSVFDEIVKAILGSSNVKAI